MSSKKQTFRVFRCPHCSYTGYRLVLHDDGNSKCNLCSKTISPSSEMSHVNNVDDALAAVQKLVMRSPQSPMSKARHGLGVRRRVLNIVSDLSDLNRGRGVSRERVLEECSGAKIDLDKAEKFLNQLEDEGLITEMDGQLAPTECGDW
ncbi:MAG: hypothetical protein ACXAEN_26400 [Candidatus Thorarchaeota archaeon]